MKKKDTKKESLNQPAIKNGGLLSFAPLKGHLKHPSLSRLGWKFRGIRAFSCFRDSKMQQK